jgi:hypothetical protein
MRVTLVLLAISMLGQGASPDVAFRMHRIDAGQSETAALVDVNKDGRLDIVSSESWYEAPGWTKHDLRKINFTNNYVDNFSDLPADVDGDGYTDLVQIGYFARRIVWMKNPGKSAGPWVETEIDAIGPTEFAFLVDLNNDGKPLELLPQFTGAAKAGLCWYELQGGKWVKRQVAPQSYGHGIGAGDLNGDKRTDILTPQGWLEAPADVRAAGDWAFHATDWTQLKIPVGPPPGATPPLPASAPPSAAPPLRIEYGYMHVLDINKDGRNDVVTTMAHSFGVLWFEQKADGTWAQHLIDSAWSRAHASVLADVNGDGQVDFVTGTRLMGRNAAETEPLAIYWYEFRAPSGRGRQTATGSAQVEWTRHTISAGGEAGAGLQIVAGDIDNDGDIDLVSGGKSGVFLAENLRKSPKRMP